MQQQALRNISRKTLIKKFAFIIMYLDNILNYTKALRIAQLKAVCDFLGYIISAQGI